MDHQLEAAQTNPNYYQHEISHLSIQGPKHNSVQSSSNLSHNETQQTLIKMNQKSETQIGKKRSRKAQNKKTKME